MRRNFTSSLSADEGALLKDNTSTFGKAPYDCAMTTTLEREREREAFLEYFFLAGSILAYAAMTDRDDKGPPFWLLEKDERQKKERASAQEFNFTCALTVARSPLHVY